MHEFRILEVFLPSKQDNSAATTDIASDEIHNLMTELIQQGKDIEKLKLHWHSHADMGVFHSGTDEDNYATLQNGEYLVSLVINRSGSFLGRVDYQSPVSFSVSGVPIYLVVKVDDISEKVKINLDKLDKYMEEHKYERGYVGGTLGNSKAVSTSDEDIVRIKVGMKLGISKKLRKKFENCYSINCETCKHIGICQQYNYEVDEELGTYERGRYVNGYGDNGY
jgi:hypothetical protein